MAEKKQQPQQAQDEQQAELEQLMNLPLSEVEKLPEEKRNWVYEEMGRQAAAIFEKDFPNGLDIDLAGLLEVPQKAAEALQEIVRRFNIAQETWQQKWEAMRNYDFGRMAEAMRQLAEVGPILQPYIDVIYKEDPEKWGNATVTEMYAAAVKAARADGKEVKPLWFEQAGEQLAMELDKPEEEEPKTIKKEPATPAGILGTIKTVQAIKAAAHVMPNNALMNAMEQKPAINAGPFDLVVSNPQGRRKEITNYTIVSYEPDEMETKLEVSKLTEYERQVSDAVISLWVEAQKRGLPPVITDDMIYQSMPGGGEKPSPAQRGAITRAMRKFRRLHIYMDATEELRKRGKIGKDEIDIIDGYYFDYVQNRQKAINSKVYIYTYLINGKPVMLDYGERTGQILTVQAKYLDIRKIKGGIISSEIIAMTPGRQAMTGYMLRRIAVIRHDEEAARDALRQYNKRRQKETDLEAKPLAAFRKKSRVILFDTIFTETGTATENRAQTKDNRDFCFSVLDYWQVTGLIKGYAEQHKGRKITGFTVTIP